MRKLATIRKIKAIKDHPNADKLELAAVDGWQVVVKKGEFAVGDKCVYFEIDSFLPIQPEFEFLRKGGYKKLPDGTEGFRLRTIRLRKERSQGLVLPVSTFGFGDLEVGTDLTDKLNVIKYEPPVPVSLSGKVKGNFPSKVPKTDEERIQNIDENTLRQCMFGDIHLEVKEKLDGTSFTAYLLDGQFGVCSRNWDLERDENNTYWQVALKLGLEEKMRKLSEEVQIKEFAVQGELVGPGIQKNRYALSELDVYFFTFHNVDRWERDQLLLNIFTSENGLNQAPLIVNTELVREHEVFEFTIEDWLNYAEGASALNKRTEREGVVVRDIAGNSFSFKAISNKFLDNE